MLTSTTVIIIGIGIDGLSSLIVKLDPALFSNVFSPVMAALFIIVSWKSGTIGPTYERDNVIKILSSVRLTSFGRYMLSSEI